MTPALKFAHKYKTIPQNYWLMRDLYKYNVKKNETMTIKDIHHLLEYKGVQISYRSLCRWLKK